MREILRKTPDFGDRGQPNRQFRGAATARWYGDWLAGGDMRGAYLMSSPWPVGSVAIIRPRPSAKPFHISYCASWPLKA
jgi:hypothetical protein